MNQYTLDFSDPAQPQRQWQRNTRPRQRTNRTFRRTVLLLSGLICGISVVGLLRQQAAMQTIRERYQTQSVRYDSLMAAKGEVDRQLEQLRTQLVNTHP